jgi:DNA-binding MarR family transcriptional regulator
VAPARRDVQAMVTALFTVAAGLERARRKEGVSTLNLLHVIATRWPIHPSEIAELQQVHPSQVTRQVQDLENSGYVQVTQDPVDRRSCLVAVTPEGLEEMQRLTQIGLERFAQFVADWEPEEVRILTSLLEKLEKSKAAVAAREQRLPGRGWARRPPAPTRPAD